VRPGAYPTVEHLKGNSLGFTRRLEIITKDKHSSFLQKYVNYGCNKFIVQVPGFSTIKLFTMVIIETAHLYLIQTKAYIGQP
jgi:hypothetical protein